MGVVHGGAWGHAACHPAECQPAAGSKMGHPYLLTTHHPGEHCGQHVWLSLHKVKTMVSAVLWHNFFSAHCSSILCKWVTRISWSTPTTSAGNGWFSSILFLFSIPLSLLPHSSVKQGCTLLPWHNAAWLRDTEPICLSDNMKNSIELQKLIFFFFFNASVYYNLIWINPHNSHKWPSTWSASESWFL